MSAAAEHTPGPWFVVEVGANGSWPNGCEIAIDDREGGNEERDYYLASAVHGDPDELHANALLIAAAPELLEAPRDLVTMRRRSMVGSVPLREIEGLWRRAIAAVDKAGGGAA